MRFVHLIGAVFVLFASPAMAKDAVLAWTVAQKSGDVRVVRSGKQPASVNLRSTLSPGDIVTTGADGRAMLTKGEDYVVVAPGSRLVLPKEQQMSGFTRLIQQLGTMLYKVKHTGVPHFEVETPMLAAVVKGTTFSVVVDQKGAAVQVTRGRRRGQRADRRCAPSRRGRRNRLRRSRKARRDHRGQAELNRVADRAARKPCRSKAAARCLWRQSPT